MALKGYLETIALEPTMAYYLTRGIQTRCLNNSEIHEVNSKIADYSARARTLNIWRKRVSVKSYPGEEEGT